MSRCLTSLGAAVLWFSLVAGLSAEAQGASIPPGTQIQIRLLDKLDTGEAKPGQSFSATVAQPVVVGGRTVLARGARVSGQVMEVVSSGRLKKPASITLELTRVAGTSLRTQPLRIDEKSHLVRNAELIGGGAGAGALIGGLAGGKKGALIGAAVGAGAGTATAYMTGKKEIVLPAEMALTFVSEGAGGKVAATTASRAESQTSESGEALREGRRPRTEREEREEVGEREEGEEREGREAAEVALFSDRDQRLIRRYFQANTANLPPGLAKRGGNLPPGLEKHLQRDGTLPPGLQKRIEPFPAALNQQLPRLPAGYSRVILAGRALILDRANRILDIMFVHQ